MAVKSASDVAAKWRSGMSGAGEAFKRGVAAVTESPCAAAAARADAYQEGVARAVAERRYQDSLSSVTLEDWKKAMINKGATRLTSGAAEAEPKMANFYAEFLPYVQQGVDMLKTMPRGSFEQNLERANAMARFLHKFKRTRRR